MMKPLNFNGEMIYEITEIKQYYSKKKSERFSVKSPEKVEEFLRNYIGYSTSEQFIVLGLNTKNEIVLCYKAFKGTVNSSVIHPRECFQTLIINNCNSAIFCHNHPSSSSHYSQEDLQAARRLVEAGNIIGIEVLDNCIVTDEEFLSFRTEGLI